MTNPSNTILLVEDSTDDIAAVKRALKKAGIVNPLQVIMDGRDALDFLMGNGEFADRQKFPLPFLVLLDLKLPRRDGFEILEWIRSDPDVSAIPVVVLTCSDDELHHQKAYSLGARSYLVKPPTVDELERVVGMIQIYWSKFGDRGPVLQRLP